jgi:predicted GH43/DUF377 family glycosyl hydrolase
MGSLALQIERTGLILAPDPRRVLLRPFVPRAPGRVASIIARVMALSDSEVESLLASVMEEFRFRHGDIEAVLEAHYALVRPHLFSDLEPERARRLLLGSYFTAEYALESAALFNPSIVPHPDQEGLPPGCVRFIMSFRATGEGHISSIEFREGCIEGSKITIEPAGRLVTAPRVEPNPSYNKALFVRKLGEMGFVNRHSQEVLAPLEETFSLSELQASLRAAEVRSPRRRGAARSTYEAIRWLAESNYQVDFPATVPLAERVIFPVSANERNGIEDARFVRFVDSDGSVTYYATYTAYNGQEILPQLLETQDFLSFRMRTLNGPAVQNKGMALFPRRVQGRYAMLSRQDNENLFIMFSDHLHFWHDAHKLLRPSYPWEFVQIGNCGSPLETEAGWLVLTHGVGPMRKYCIGAILLDLEDPTRVVGRLSQPLLAPDENEREGYVPNVVYSCGAMLHQGRLILPYAMSDTASSIATVPLDALLSCLRPV